LKVSIFDFKIFDFCELRIEKENHFTPKFAKVVSDKSNTSNCYKKFILAKRSDVKLECLDPANIYSTNYKWNLVSITMSGASWRWKAQLDLAYFIEIRLGQ
jgi:hypothetical protein